MGKITKAHDFLEHLFIEKRKIDLLFPSMGTEDFTQVFNTPHKVGEYSLDQDTTPDKSNKIAMLYICIDIEVTPEMIPDLYTPFNKIIGPQFDKLKGKYFNPDITTVDQEPNLIVISIEL